MTSTLPLEGELVNDGDDNSICAKLEGLPLTGERPPSWRLLLVLTVIVIYLGSGKEEAKVKPDLCGKGKDGDSAASSTSAPPDDKVATCQAACRL